MENKAVFLDRDGTINQEKNYLYKKEDFIFLPHVIEALQMLSKAGYLLIIVTNQSGIARGYYQEDDLIRLNQWMTDELAEHGVKIDAIYYCPHLPDAVISEYRKKCDCRKPEIGLFMKAVEEFDIDLSRSFAVGDKLRDCMICTVTQCRGFLIGENEESQIIHSVRAGEYKKIQKAENLYECAKMILEGETK